MVFWHEGHVVEEYCGSLEDLLPNRKRPPSNHGPILYHGTQDQVLLGDNVFSRYWLFFRGYGTVKYVPGISPLKRELERDGLAWVRINMPGVMLDTIVIDGVLKKGTKLISRAGAANAI